MSESNRTPEQFARDRIDQMLTEAGWCVQAKDQIDFSSGTGIAIREYPTDSGPADYMLFIDRKPIGVIEAKRPELNTAQKTFLKFKTFYGNEYVASTRRLALMNILLHSIGDIDSEPTIEPTDALIAPPKKTFDYVLTNPPFGKKSAITLTNGAGKAEKEDLTYNRQDFWVTTSNKQLNFVQHVHAMLKTTGKAAIVVPDNVLFEGGAGETVRRKLLETTDLHTVLRLPTGPNRNSDDAIIIDTHP